MGMPFMPLNRKTDCSGLSVSSISFARSSSICFARRCSSSEDSLFIFSCSTLKGGARLLDSVARAGVRESIDKPKELDILLPDMDSGLTGRCSDFFGLFFGVLV